MSTFFLKKMTKDVKKCTNKIETTLTHKHMFAILKIVSVGDKMELKDLRGLGPKGIEKLARLGITSVADLLSYYPYRYEMLQRTNMDAVQDQEKVVIDGIVESEPRSFYFKRNMNRMSFRCQAQNRIFSVSIFNRSFLKQHLQIGTNIIIIGKYDQKHNTITASDIRFGVLSDIPELVPIYHLTDGITEKQLRQYIENAFQDLSHLVDEIPSEISRSYHFLSKADSVRIVHKPQDTLELKKARTRLKYEELFTYMLKLNLLKRETKMEEGLKRTQHHSELQSMIESLPFQLTEDQEKCIFQIERDFLSSHRMNRLIQGDVGSGKTVLSFLAIYLNYLDGYQSAFMAPTEILASQHYDNMKKQFQNIPIKIAKLTGKLTIKEKREIWNGLESGEIDVVVGTHALISENVIYRNLGLVITDEQHRFGVNQRANLKNKGIRPDVLYMSATPIPRTYALTLYGDMDISSIHTVPSGKKKIITLLKKESEMKDVLMAMYEELKKHHQIYVVAPLIEESDKSEETDVYKLEQNMNKAFGKVVKIGVLHGKMKPEEKEEIMKKFQANEIQILISTTVIEVGVDVKNATMIVIFDAFRFGLATLHQLRGRVGRNDFQSYAILISNHETERLSILTNTNDGFKISEEDFKLRGSGDLFGLRQSGDMVFQIANLKQDLSIALRAKEDSERYLEQLSEEQIKQKAVCYLD